MFFYPLMSHNVDCLFPSLSCLINPLWPSPSFTAFHKTRMKWGRKTSPVLKALNNLLSQFGNNLNQFDVLSNKICCCLPISAAPWMTVNLHFLIKLAGIFIRGLGYANGNVVYSRLTEFWNKFNRDTFAGEKKWVIVFNLFHSNFSWGILVF